jgi:hypothetical protein
VTALESVQAFVEAALTADGERAGALALPDARWTTPKGMTYPLRDVLLKVAPPEDYPDLAVEREGHRFEEVAPGRVLVLYDTVYRWKDEEALVNRVPSGYVVNVRDGLVADVRAFLDADKAQTAAREGEAEATIA